LIFQTKGKTRKKIKSVGGRKRGKENNKNSRIKMKEDMETIFKD
jgi:hypothetical protein